MGLVLTETEFSVRMAFYPHGKLGWRAQRASLSGGIPRNQSKRGSEKPRIQRPRSISAGLPDQVLQRSRVDDADVLLLH
jgi:hypothetical protein